MEKIDQILDSLYDRVIEPCEAKEQLLLLFSVSGSLCDYCKDDRTAVCCQTCLDEMIDHTANTQ